MRVSRYHGEKNLKELVARLYRLDADDPAAAEAAAGPGRGQPTPQAAQSDARQGRRRGDPDRRAGACRMVRRAILGAHAEHGRAGRPRPGDRGARSARQRRGDRRSGGICGAGRRRRPAWFRGVQGCRSCQRRARRPGQENAGADRRAPRSNRRRVSTTASRHRGRAQDSRRYRRAHRLFGTRSTATFVRWLASR